MADDMDVDMDIDLGHDDYDGEIEIEVVQTEAQPVATQELAKGVPEAYDIDIDKTIPAPTKVHIRGLDNLTTTDITNFASEHYSKEEFKRVEWIDDSSANIVYNTPAAGLEALNALSESISSHPSELRRAKQCSTHPNVELQVRQAFAGDVKAPRAREKSRFYLMNPDQDPAERRYDDRYSRIGRGRGRGRRENEGRGRQAEPKPFDVNMYDDDAGVSESEPRQLSRQESRGSYGSAQDRKEVLDRNGRANGRLRDRSASPARGEDGRYGFEEGQSARRTARRRSYTPPSRRRESIVPANNSSKELFPTKVTKVSTAAMDSTPLPNGNAGVDLFPNHSVKRNRELFPHKTPHSNHRRSDALDAEETAYLMSPSSLASRITGGPTTARRNDEDNGYSFKGRANAPSDFSILGASRGINSKVKELFPDKVPSNTGKELFTDTMRARAPRRRADELL